VSIDKLDHRILGLLKNNARATNQELGNAVGLSAPAAYQRVRRLEADGYILGYHAHVNAAKLGRRVTVLLRVRLPSGSDPSAFESSWQGATDVEECLKLAEAGTYQLRIRLNDVAALEPHLDMLHRKRCTTGVDFVLQEVLDRRR
jgi:Lrp/AsnC family leucine-responsive transcriptional regulator